MASKTTHPPLSSVSHSICCFLPISMRPRTAFSLTFISDLVTNILETLILLFTFITIIQQGSGMSVVSLVFCLIFTIVSMGNLILNILVIVKIWKGEPLSLSNEDFNPEIRTSRKEAVKFYIQNFLTVRL